MIPATIQTPTTLGNQVVRYQGKNNQTYTLKQLAGACCFILSWSVKLNFERKYLTGQAREQMIIRVKPNSVVWEHKPQKYDTAHYLKHRIIIHEAGSYALDLQKYGSRFLVYKKRKNQQGEFYNKQSGSRKWEKLNLEKVMIYRGNHKNYFGEAFIRMVEFLIGLGGEIEWNIH